MIAAGQALAGGRAGRSADRVDRVGQRGQALVQFGVGDGDF